MKTSSWVCGIVLGSLSLMGCGGGVDGVPEARESSAPLEFRTRAELYDWLVAQAALLGIPDITVKRNASSEIESVVLPGDSRDVLIAKLHGSAGFFKVEGHDITLPSSPTQPQAETTTKAPAPAAPGPENVSSTSAALTSGIPDNKTVCSGAFCLYGSSWNQHYSLFGLGYHDVGGSAGSNGIATTYTALVRPDLGCGTRIGCSAPQYYCQGQDHLDVQSVRTSYYGGTTIATCYHSIGFDGVTNTYFSNVDNCGSGHCQNQPTAVRVGMAISPNWYASDDLWAIGLFALPCTNNNGPAECYIDGVCSNEFAMGPGGSASALTAAGSYDCQ
jgi:hypothetical protein